MSSFLSDLEIANQANKKHINDIAKQIDVPELKDLDKSVIHDPPKEHRKYCGYPDQILDLKLSRLRAIDAFKAAKS